MALAALATLSLSACTEFAAESKVQPLRPVDVSKSTATAANASSNEVGVAAIVNVKIADTRGVGILGVQPTITAVTSGGVAVSSITSNGCSVSNSSGISTCTLTSTSNGTYFIKVTSPSVFTGGSITFDQRKYGLKFAAQPTCSSCAVRSNFTASVQVVDRVGNAITSGTDAAVPITLSLTSPGSATLAGTLSVTSSGGLASFTTLNVNKTGSYTLTASAPGMTSATSSAFTLTAGIATRLAFTTQPSASAAANIAFAQQPAVTIQDADGNAVTTLSCTITLNKAGASAGSLVGTASMPANSGVASFSGLRISTTSGGSSYYLTAAASGPSTCAVLTPASSSTFSITLSGVPYQLSLYTPPSSAALSAQWATQPVVQVLDSFGNLVSGDNSTVVTIAKNGSSPGGALAGSRSIPVVNGTATFSDLYINSTNTTHAGTYTYDITGSYPGVSLVGVTASNEISADGQITPFRLEFSVQPGNASLSQVMAAVKVRKVDNNGFLNFTDNSSTVTISMYSSPGTLAGTTTKTLANGVATFDDLRITAGSGVQTFAAASSDSSVSGTTSVNFRISDYSTPAKLAWTTSPTGTSGTSSWTTSRVEVQDAAGNRVANDNTTQVTLSVFQYATSASATLVGNTTQTVQNGVATFSNIRTTELGITNIVLLATSANNSAVTGAQSDTFNGNTAAAASLRFAAQPVTAILSNSAYWISSATGTAPVAISVEILDANGTRITSDNTTSISLLMNGCGGNLTGSTSVTVNQGLATFSGLLVDTSNHLSCAITASYGSISRVSNAFNIPNI